MTDSADVHIQRVRRLCQALPESSEKPSHGEPTFFVGKKVFAMFSNNHHNDGHIGVWIPVSPGLQSQLIKSSPEKFYYPPCVGVRAGWVSSLQISMMKNLHPGCAKPGS
ncbi:MAG: phosphoribosylglycinamide formyltransferase [Chloroflexi bacterium HGW-Chloroflexi-6]|nr:MAG: phosphoribosylglycinamide formyltransferase [Chloroflexi bacterium HGW-Chloroflexi-6]